jgi:hypothetical protein
MALTEKGLNALNQARKYFPKGSFSAKDLSEACGEKIVAAVLNAVANQGYMQKLGGTPVEFCLTEGLTEEDFAALAEQKKGADNKNLRRAKRIKNDEFYTRYEDIEAEVMKYRKQFAGKVVYLPCDDPAEKKSEFWSFFVNNFDAFGLKKLIATHYDENGHAYKIWIEDDLSGDGYIDDSDALQEDLAGDGDFRSPECVEILKECDVIVTNPPFSLFREFVELIMTHNKQFLIIGNKNAFTYKEIFKLIKDNKVWVGYTSPKNFRLEDGSTTDKINGLCRWFTNLHSSKRNEELVLTKTYQQDLYPSYDNYNAIEVNKVVNIPKDYLGVMGVPVTFIDNYNPNQFEIIGGFNGYKECDYLNGLICGTETPYLDKKTGKEKMWTGPTINKEAKYFRILIKRK